MESAPKDLHTQQFLQPHIAQVDIVSEMLEKCELARFVGSLKYCDIQPKLLSEAIYKITIQGPLVIERTHSARAFSSLDDKLDCPGIEPGSPTTDCLIKRLLGEGA